MNDNCPESLRSMEVRISQNPVPGWCLLLLLIALAVVAASCGVTTSLPRATTTLAGPEATQVQFVAPVDENGNPLPGIAISSVVSGSCEPGSDAIEHSSLLIYRCDSVKGVSDPCWAANYGKSSTDAVLCMRNPWDTSAVKITTEGLPPEGRSSKVVDGEPVADLRTPWGVELVNGQRFIEVQGAGDFYDGTAIRWGSPDNNSIGLLEDIDTGNPLWTVTEVEWNGTKYESKGRVAIERVWAATPG